MKSTSSRLAPVWSGGMPRWRFLALFAGGAALILFWVMMENLFIKRLSFAFLLEFPFQATVFVLVLLVVILQFYTDSRLHRIERKLSAPAYEGRDDVISRSLLRLPDELFWMTVAYAVVAIPIYHAFHYFAVHRTFADMEPYYQLNFVRSYLYELAVSLSAGVLYYAVARWLVRPVLASLPRTGDRLLKGRSFSSTLTMTYGILLSIELFSLMWYVLMTQVLNVHLDLQVLVTIAVLQWVFAFLILVVLCKPFRKELLLLADRLRQLGNASAAAVKSSAAMPILSDDEVGRLAVAFNRLHKARLQEYDELVAELRLARQLQRELLPQTPVVLQGCTISAVSETRREVGCGFYDTVPLGAGQLAVVAGEVTGEGLPAALQMSALLMLLGAEMQGGGSPEDILGRFKHSLEEVFPKGAALSVALAVIDVPARKADCAAEGGMSLCMVSKNGAASLLPPHGAVELFPGDALLILSPAAADSLFLRRPQADWYPIPDFPDVTLPLEPQLERVLHDYRMDRTGTGLETDFTIMALSCLPESGGSLDERHS